MKARGIRNNNPGNIRRSADSWQGLAPTQSDPEYFQFTSMVYGVRAAAKILRNYASRYGINTVAGIITRWAPHVENPTAAYITNVSRALAVSPTQTIDVNNEATLRRLLTAIFRQENGGDFVDTEVMTQGIRMALNG